MESIPSDMLACLDEVFKQRNIPFGLRPAYRKWVRYFWDFRSKYAQLEDKMGQVRLFSEKLRSKGQTDVQIAQAADAVSLFFVVDRRKQVSSSGHPEVDVPVRDSMENPPKPHPAQPAAATAAGTVCGPPGTPLFDGNYRRRKGLYDEWRCLKRSGHDAWDAVIGLLADEIKAKHYSRKTLQHYGNWTRKFQHYVSHKDPAGLVSQDVKSYLTYLAVQCKVSSSTQNLAFNALLFIYRHILKRDFGDQKDVPRAKRSSYIPVVLAGKDG